MDRPEEPPVASEQPGGSVALVVRSSTALAERVGRRMQRWMPGLDRVRGGLRHMRDGLLRHPLADELERSRRDNDQLQKLLAELPEIFERKYQQRLEPLLEHQYRLLEDNALLMDQLRLLQASSAPEQQQLVSAESRAAAGSVDPSVAPEPAFTAMTADPLNEPGQDFSIDLDGAAPLADVQTLLHSPPWGVLDPALIQVRPPAGSPQRAPEPQAPRNEPPQPSFEELVALASQQVPPAAEVVDVPMAAPGWVEAAPILEILSPDLSEELRGGARTPGASIPPVALTAAAEPFAPQAEPQELPVTQTEAPDPLEQARARRLQAWRRSRRQGSDA